jgi:hypothetical protein
LRSDGSLGLSDPVACESVFFLSRMSTAEETTIPLRRSSFAEGNPCTFLIRMHGNMCAFFMNGVRVILFCNQMHNSLMLY